MIAIAVTFSLGTVALDAAGVQTVNEASATPATQNDIHVFLTNLGYTVTSITKDPATRYNWYATAILNGQNHYLYLDCDANGLINVPIDIFI